jgi:hypothetical protein
VFLSTNSGANWTAADTGLTNKYVTAFAMTPASGGTNIFAGTSGGGVFLSTDGGADWTPVNNGLVYMWVTTFAVNGTQLFAGTSNGISLSTNNGANWTTVNTGLTNKTVRALAVYGTNLFAGTAGGVFISTNSGASWSIANSGLANISVNALALFGQYLFAGTYGSSAFRRPLSDMVVSVGPFPGEVPAAFRLEQNYPNPFNPSTTIRFELPHASHVSLTIYDLLGREVMTLVDEVKPAGAYNVQFNAANVSSGMYVYRLRAGDFVAARDLLLLK